MPGFLLRGMTLVVAIVAIADMAAAGEKVVLRAGDGRFLRVDPQGTVRPAGFLPEPDATFEIDVAKDGRATLTAADGRRLDFEPSSEMLVRAEDDARDGRPTAIHLVPAARGGFAFGVEEAPDDGAGNPKPKKDDAVEPPPEPSAGIYLAGELPDEMRTALAEILNALAAGELTDRAYDKTKVRPKRKYVNLPAPTLKDPGRMKRHQILAYTEEQRVQAALDGPLELFIHRMPYLRQYGDPASKLLLFSVEATVPVRGLVQYKIRDRLSATAKYRAVVHVRTIGELALRKEGGSIEFDVPRLLEFRVDLESLELSNDVLDSMRGTIRDVLNRELADRRAEITAKANKAVAKAVKTREFSHPALKLLMLP